MNNNTLISDRADTVVVLDFETSGLSPNMGDRAIEIGAVWLEGGVITRQFQQLMNPGFRISGFIESYTGITNDMLAAAHPCEVVMSRFADLIDGYNLVAHNASFDRRFLDSELAVVDKTYAGSFVCSMLTARRMYQEAPNHRLGTLVEYKNIKTDGPFHRALADAQMTARLWQGMVDDITRVYGIGDVPFSLMQKLSKKSKHLVPDFLRGYKNEVQPQ